MTPAMTTLELIKAAHKKKTVSVNFHIPIDGVNVPVVLTVGDRFEIAETQDMYYNELYGKYEDKGLDKRRINKLEYEKELKQFKEGLKGTPEENKKSIETYEKGKPENRADQMANKWGRIRTIQEIVPRFLKTPEGEPVFKTESEIKEMIQVVREDNDLFSLLSENYVKLFSEVRKAEDAVKNLPKQENSESGT